MVAPRCKSIPWAIPTLPYRPLPCPSRLFPYANAGHPGSQLRAGPDDRSGIGWGLPADGGSDSPQRALFMITNYGDLDFIHETR
jgi:hypothetical protein